MQESPPNVRAFSLGLIANLIWATSFLGSKYTLLAWGPVTSSFIRFGLASIAMLCLLLVTNVRVALPTRSEVKPILLIALFQFGLLYPLQLFGLKYIPTSLSAAIMLLSPLFVILLGAAYLGEALSRQKVAAVCVGIIGGLILLNVQAQPTEYYFEGAILTVLAALCLAVATVLTRKYAPNIPTAHLTLWSMIAGSVYLLPFLVWENRNAENMFFTVSSDYPAIIAMFYLAIICSALTFYIWNKALSLTQAKNLASTMHIKTPVAMLIGIALAGEVLAPSVLFGSAVVFFGVWLSQADLNRFNVVRFKNVGTRIQP